MMLSRSAFGRTAPRVLRTQCTGSRRGLASAASPSFQYETSEAAGVKVANREVQSPTTTLALVAKAGPRYQPFPGFTAALEQFAFKVCYIQAIASPMHFSSMSKL
jgi:ubiquinol-cytochrome c reductase core subunit 2